MTFRRFSKRVLFVLLLFSAESPDLPAQSLDSLLRLATTSHPVVASVSARVAATRERSRSLEAWSPPRVGLRISMLPPSEPNPFGAGETMVMAEQEIPLGGMRRRMAAAELAGIPAEESRLEILEIDLRREIARHYFTIWEIDRRIELNRENRELLEKLYEEARARFTLSQRNSATLYDLAADIEKLDADLQRLGSLRRESVAGVNIATGRPLDLPVEVIMPEPVDTLPEFSELLAPLASHPSLLRMERMAEEREAMAEARSAALEPMVMVSAGVSVMPDGHPVRSRNLSMMVGEIGTEGGSSHGGILGLSFGGMISIPTASWSRGSADAAEEADRLEALAYRADRSAMLRRMTEELRSMLGMAERAAIMELYFREKQIPLLQKEIEVLRVEYLAGRTHLSGVIEAYRMLLMIREEIVMQSAERVRAIEEIEIMTGVDINRSREEQP